MDKEILFSETQKFRQWWLWILLIGSNVFTFYGVYKQIVTRHAFGEKPASNTELLISSGITMLLTILFLIIQLDTQIRKDGVYVRFFLLHLKFRHYLWTQLSKCYVKKYSPMGEFGGWGLRIGFSGKAYNISGNQGLQLEFTNNKRLLIGTRKPNELSEALINVGQLNP
ncbi:MAG: hypothetical protein M3Z26_06375 [Bacteroidota bacterium]|nr:hypothetical protein [Bacteroidota bacterium]